MPAFNLKGSLITSFEKAHIEPEAIDALVESGYCSDIRVFNLLNHWLSQEYPKLKPSAATEEIRWVEESLIPRVKQLSSTPRIDQAHILEKLKVYCHFYAGKEPRDPEFVAQFNTGYCFGLSTLIAYGINIGQTSNKSIHRDDWRWTKKTLELLSDLDEITGTLKTTKRKLTALEINDIERLLSLIQQFQHRLNFTRTFSLNAMAKHLNDAQTKQYQHTFSFAGLIDRQELKSTLQTTLYKSKHRKKIIPIHSHNHVMHINKNHNTYLFYDANSLTGPINENRPNKLARMVSLATDTKPNDAAFYCLEVINRGKNYKHKKQSIYKLKSAKAPNAPMLYSNNKTSLIFAAMMGSYPSVRAWIKLGSDVNQADQDGNTALHFATEFNRTDIMNLLIANKAQLEKKNNKGKTPIHNAASNAPDAIYLLAKRGANLNSKDNNGHTSLMTASYCGHMLSMTALIKCRADIHATDHEQNTALHFASSKNHIDGARLLLHHGARLDTKNIYGNTALHSATCKNAYNTAQVLAEAKPEIINWQNKKKQTALIMAAQNGAVKTIKVLLEFKADMELKDNNHFNPLHYATCYNHNEAMVALLKGGAAVDAPSIDNRTALHIAATRNLPKAAEILVNHGANIYATARTKSTAFHLAAQENSLAFMQYLLNKELSMQEEKNPHCVAENRSLAMQDINGNTPLHNAARNGHVEMVKLLLRYGANPFLTNRTGQKPIDCCLHPAIRELLKDTKTRSPSPDISDSDELSEILARPQSLPKGPTLFAPTAKHSVASLVLAPTKLILS